jgi:hypothetical protein
VAKGLTSDARENLRAVIRDRVLGRFETELDAAVAMKVDPTALNRLLKHGTGGSLEFAEKVARYLNEPTATILFGSDEPPEPTLREMPGFADAMAEAKRRIEAEHPGITEANLSAAGNIVISPPLAHVSAGLLIHLAMTARVARPPKKRRK